MNFLITLAYFVMSKSFSLIVHIKYQMTVLVSREISSGLSPMSCVQTLQTCLAATCLLVWSPESGQDLTSRVRELMTILIFSQLILWRFSIFFPEADDKKCVSEESIQNDKNIIQIKLVF